MHREVYLIVDRVRSLYNVGSLFRTADAFGVKKIYLCGYTGAPPRKEISKVALGAEKTVPWEKRGQTWKVVEELKAQGIYVVALENNMLDRSRRSLAGAPRQERRLKPAATIDSWHPKFPLALVVGNEVNGVSDGVLKRVDAVVEIPMLGQKESLNVSVAAGVALYVLRHGK
ncbi:hypothetical protein A3B21_01865 [Candidatus Uhrbacteria bacterium RIFCSPLOWO2_01_FULL_47_24]|uniref:tRNA/rRNA methyltransferase SpoU type domain-containing protein n=1 Tax=Candidatus Uhrbacteria bacterium RIFCSPLOWO2_01_FULL_47_24 TaxID=1802401 RepID=A0A1F7UP96_9BACT|nr:MAG: hypothetical protein A2753_01615 [Candidatus Uhrbacteria bacterium RIFCSPHIGHO2_01_FULL_47_11]OGL67915.1 MAG: hypothetical protein A3D58_05060 [Candidatus Uhrbacteria bacterium RIFCSPHIGHO2_02_FULL_46_47]OGL75186.1 MAG: hypothetical protein A3F52_04050 [Candidatus Uhrbacteria bacterium RIFCSPHIGHO2_12_FULL_47_11]OGL80101.1 MAG: hypothetical protein A3B21_01865 [Candidatus Uhrbacteria bacterium RIFCSPLOWO2_01_FULL_47_24]OGL84887.1 MAG: hypothetical protein A3J03_04250 [Candidatus Uhrbact